MTKSREMVIKIQLGRVEMESPSDVSWLLNNIRAALVDCAEIEDCKNKFNDANGHRVCEIEFDPRYELWNVEVDFANDLEIEDVERAFALHVGSSNFIDLDEVVDSREVGKTRTHVQFEVQMDREFMEENKNMFFQSPSFQFKLVRR